MLQLSLKLNKLSYLISLVSILLSLFSLFLFTPKLGAQTAANPINFSIPTVEVDGARQSTRKLSATSWVFDGQLDSNDVIRYRWEGIDLNLKYIENPARGGGYLKIYKDAVAEPNFLLNHGTDVYPLQVSGILDRLSDGPNTLQFVYVNSLSKVESAPVSLTFNLLKENDDPAVEIVKPQPGAIFANGIEQEIILNLSNFSLSPATSNSPNVGQILIYHTQIAEPNFLGKITTANAINSNQFQAIAKSTDFKFDALPDNLETKLFFVLADSAGRSKNIVQEVSVSTNFQNSLNLGLPKVTIIEPQKNRTDQTVTGDTKFILQLENFEILTSVPVQSENDQPDNKKGYLQISIYSGDTGMPIQPRWGKNEFTLNEIDFQSTSEGQKTVRVQLVDKNFELLKPEAKDEISIFYKPATSLEADQEIKVENNVWRLVFIGLTVVLVVGGISVLIAKG